MTSRSTPGLVVREAVREDVPLVLSFIQELAEYEHLSHEVVASEEQLEDALFGAPTVAEVIIAEIADEPVGFALYFHNFSTFLARRGIYLEDLYVRPAARRKGVGMALLVHLARLTKVRHCGRLEWTVLDWNQSAINFYRNIGAVGRDEWTVYRLSGDALDDLADGNGKSPPT